MWLFKVFIFIASLNLYNAVDVLPKVVMVEKDKSYTILIKDDKLTPKECFLDDGKNKYELELETSSPANPLATRGLITQKASTSTDIITSLGNGICGFKVDNVRTKVVNWNISFTDVESNKIYSKSVNAFIREPSPRVTKQFAAVGDSIYIAGCSQMYDKDQVTAHYCQLYNPTGELVMMAGGKCQYSIANSTAADFGKWKCLINYEVSMDNTLIEIEVIKQVYDIIKTWTNETETHVNIGCSITNPSMFSTFMSCCVMVRPDGEQFALTAGKATQRYTSLKTDLEKNICNIEILKPLEESEKGLWRCEMQTGRSPIGGFIDLSTSKSSKQVNQVETPKKVVANLGGTLTARCRVPYSSPYCYMIGADGLMYAVEDARSPTFGLCEFSKISNLTDSGTWYCGFAMSNGEPDKLYPFDVIVPEQLRVKAEQETIDSYRYSAAKLVCTTKELGNYPLKYCRFRSPKGDIYFIKNQQTNDRISYSGRGLEYGDCGILIHDVTKEDEGIWSCITRIGNDFKNKEVYSNIHLSVNENMSVASAVGIAVGVGIVVTGVMVIAARTIRRRRINATFNRNATARTSNSSDSSGNSAVVFNLDEPSTSRNYNSTGQVQNIDGNNVTTCFSRKATTRTNNFSISSSNSAVSFGFDQLSTSRNNNSSTAQVEQNDKNTSTQMDVIIL